jgi:hypothetical protein
MPKRGFLARHLIFPNIINASGGFWHPRACFFFSNRLTYSTDCEKKYWRNNARTQEGETFETIGVKPNDEKEYKRYI